MRSSILISKSRLRQLALPVVFLASLYIAGRVDFPFLRLVLNLYVHFSGGEITTICKHFFPSIPFLFAFAIAVLVLYQLLAYQIKQISMSRSLIAVLAFPFVLCSICYFDAYLKMATHTIRPDGTILLNCEQLAYWIHFTVSMLSTLLILSWGNLKKRSDSL